MFDSKILEISIGTVIKDPEILGVVLDQYKTQQMPDKVLENGWMTVFVPDCKKYQKICDNTVNSSAYTAVFVPDCYKTKQLCDKVVITYPSESIFFPEWLKPQETCDKTVDVCRFLFNSVLDQHIIEELCSKVVSKVSFLLKYLQDSRNVWHCCWWFATSIKICFIFVYYK